MSTVHAGSVRSAAQVNGVNAGDVVAQVGGPDAGGLTPATPRETVGSCSRFWCECTVGTITIEVYNGGAWIPVSVAPIGATDQATWVLTLAAGNAGLYVGPALGVRLRQSGAPVANGLITGSA